MKVMMKQQPRRREETAGVGSEFSVDKLLLNSSKLINPWGI